MKHYDAKVTAKEFDSILGSYKWVIENAWTDDDIIERELSFWADSKHQGMYFYLGREYSHDNVPPDTSVYFKFKNVTQMKQDIIEVGRIIQGFKKQ